MNIPSSNKKTFFTIVFIFLAHSTHTLQSSQSKISKTIPLETVTMYITGGPTSTTIYSEPEPHIYENTNINGKERLHSYLSFHYQLRKEPVITYTLIKKTIDTLYPTEYQFKRHKAYDSEETYELYKILAIRLGISKKIRDTIPKNRYTRDYICLKALEEFSKRDNVLIQFPKEGYKGSLEFILNNNK